MKDFTRASGRLRGLPFQARLVYSVFLGFTLVALGLTGWLGADMLGTDLHGVREYYAGLPSEPAAGSAANAASAANGGGPTIDLPADANLAPVADAIPLRKLLEVTHFHLFSMPVYLMILSHLFMLSRLSARSKTWWIALASLSVALHIAAPWFARSGSTASVIAYAGSGALLTLTFLVLGAVPLYEMWTPKPLPPTAADVEL